MSQTGLVMRHHRLPGLQGLRNRSTSLTRRYAEETSVATIRGSVMNQTPDRLGVVTFSQYVALGIGQCDRYSHSAAIGHQDFPQASRFSKSARTLGDSSPLRLSSIRRLPFAGSGAAAADTNSLPSTPVTDSEVILALNCDRAVDSLCER